MRARVTAAAVGMALTLAACGGGDEPDAPSLDPSDATSSASDTATTQPVDPAAYLPTPTGVTLTDPGTELTLRRKAVGAWTPRQDLVGVVELSVTGLVVTTVEKSLGGFDLQPSAQQTTPYFVTAKVTNVGQTDLGGRQLPLYVVDSNEALVAPTGVAPDFEPCPGSTLPAIFAPGDTARSCLIFLVPPGADLDAVMFRPPEGVVPITWSGKVTRLKDRGDGRKDKGKGKNAG